MLLKALEYETFSADADDDGTVKKAFDPKTRTEKDMSFQPEEYATTHNRISEEHTLNGPASTTNGVRRDMSPPRTHDYGYNQGPHMEAGNVAR